ncbi:DNA polymerase III subunit alpha [Candidatus Roizmanbacteria bacterium RIFCSPHIGHO2_12_FULL_38_13]|nr:MAG: DNA polymerase III subunit alpha [Candidatus Roizmanbacteria bacterium RIFCSPHIGHO2_12_FULL_38_13]
MSFVHLHTHSEYSLLDGMCRIEELIAKAKSFDMPAVALTDHGALYGAFKFFIQAKDAGIKPIIGCELYKAKKSRHDRGGDGEKGNYHLLVLAKNLTGYKNLLKLVTLANMEGFYYKPRVDWELLKKYSDGLIATSGCMSAEVPSHLMDNQQNKAEEALKKYLEIFEDNFYIELQRHPQIETQESLNQKLVKLSRKFGVPLVATNDVHYLEKTDAYAQEILLCIQTQRTIIEKNRPLSMLDVPDYYFKSPKEMKSAFLDYPEAIENTLKIAEKCNLEIPYGKLILPKFDAPKGMNTKEYLTKLVTEKKNRVKNASNDQIDERLNYELDIIKNKGYANYFLFIQDIVNWAKDNGIAVGPGRGSAAGSLVAYVLRITDVNPFEHKIPFERFLNPGRPTPPDIDIDFSDKRREEVIKYISERYGKENVAQIITFGTMEARLAVRDVARALGQSYAQGDRIAKMIPLGKQGFQMRIDRALKESSALNLAYNSEEEVKKVIDIAKRVESLPRHFSVHAAGVVIADKPLIEYVPLQRDNKEGRIITQYDMYSLDLNAVSENKAVGLVKADILGLRNLSILEEAIAFVEKFRNIKIDIHDVPLDDKKTYELISRGETVGVFQLESAGMQRLAKDLQPTKLSDITAMVALYRPGPMDLIPNFISSKKNSKKIKYLHQNLKPILEESYGVIVYQEQCMEIANKFAGFTMVEADLLRMAMGKKKKSLMASGRKKFIDGSMKNGYSRKIATDLFDQIEKFSAYGFNKPHSVSYALIAYWTAYMKSNYTVEFMTALMTAELQGVAGPMREVKMSMALEESKRLDINVLPPNINKSEHDFSIENNSIRFGLSAIKNVGAAAIDSILSSRKDGGKFKGFRDFLMKVDLRRVNKKTVESLIKTGAFDDFFNRATLLMYYPQLVKEIASVKSNIEDGQFALFGGQDKKAYEKDNFKEAAELDEDKLIEFEKEVIGFLITKNPLEKHRKIIDQKVNKHIGDISEKDIDKNYIFSGLITQFKVIKTKKNNFEMAFMHVNDLTGAAEVIVFPRTYSQLKNLFKLNTVCLFVGKVTQREGQYNIILDKAVNLDLRQKHK